MIDFMIHTPFFANALQRARLADDDRFAGRVLHSIARSANDQHHRGPDDGRVGVETGSILYMPVIGEEPVERPASSR